jgi:hypothetical protein
MRPSNELNYTKHDVLSRRMERPERYAVGFLFCLALTFAIVSAVSAVTQIY